MKIKKLFIFIVGVCVFGFYSGNAYSETSVSNAISWAEGQVGSSLDSDCGQSWVNMCMHFCGHAFNIVPSGIEEAIDGWTGEDNVFSPRQTGTNFSLIPAGALVFFNTNLYPSGHVGLSVGGGKMIHAWTDVVRKENISTYSSYYLGWRWPEAWTSDPASGEALSITLRVVNGIGWYPPNKTCVNASQWYKTVDGKVIASYADNSACYLVGIEYYNSIIWHDVLFGTGDLPEECTQ